MKKGKKGLTKKSKIIVLVLIILFMLVVGCFYFYPLLKIKQIENSYNSVIEIKNDTSIYTKKNNEYVSQGNIKKGVVLNLDNSDDSGYFKIKGTNNYIYYKDIKKSNKDIKINENYIDFNQNINIEGKVDFYQDGEVVLSLETNDTFPIKEIDEEYYYIYYGNLFGVKKDDVGIIDSKNTDLLEAEYVSVIHYDKIASENETCEEVKCVELTKFEEQLEYLKSNNYYTIDLDTYEKWLDNKIRLKEKAVLLTISNNNVQDNVKEYNFNINEVDERFNYVDTNKKTTKENNKDSIDRYIITKSIDIDKFSKIVKGENFINMDLLDPNELATSIPVLNYHFFYDSSIGEECNESICLDTKDFEEQLKYLKDNGYKTLTIEEFRAWMYGEIELPKKSVLLTVDDGAMGTGTHNGNKLIPLLEKYDLYATLFLITGWWDIGNYTSNHLDVQSHTNDMHTGNLCEATRGAKILCSSKEEVIKDLKKSIEITGSDTSFCFPFYAYDEKTIEYVKEVGFKMAFVGGSYNATRTGDKYKIPRYPISKEITMQQFINMIS